MMHRCIDKYISSISKCLINDTECIRDLEYESGHPMGIRDEISDWSYQKVCKSRNRIIFPTTYASFAFSQMLGCERNRLPSVLYHANLQPGGGQQLRDSRIDIFGRPDFTAKCQEDLTCERTKEDDAKAKH